MAYRWFKPYEGFAVKEFESRVLHPLHCEIVSILKELGAATSIGLLLD